MEYSLTCVTPSKQSKSRNYCHTDCSPVDNTPLDDIKIVKKENNDSKE